jgi:hypothetical protein
MYQQVYSNVYILMHDDHFVIVIQEQQMRGRLGRN